MDIEESYRKDKRFMARFRGGILVHFGSKNGETYIDHNDDLKRDNYIKRHRRLNENWNNKYSPGALSRWILWEKKSLPEAIKFYKKKFNID
ncbi:MAG: DUF5754 family protein [Paraclostridium sp.]